MDTFGFLDEWNTAEVYDKYVLFIIVGNGVKTSGEVSIAPPLGYFTTALNANCN